MALLSADFPQMSVRDGVEADLPALIAIKGSGSAALHLDRLRAAQQGDLRYLVLLADQSVIGFACLVFRRPDYWSDAGDTRYLPQIVDLQVTSSLRGRRYGTFFIHAIENITVDAGYTHLYLSVEPINNPRAHALYQRLGYQQIQSQPYWDTWQFTDSAGVLHFGEEWSLDMVKHL